MKPLECLFIGACTEDVMMQVDALPESNRRIVARQFTRCCGGVAANAAAAFAHLGGRAGVVTAVGDDGSGDFIRGDLEKQRYAYVQAFTIPGCASAISTIHVEPDGRRSITHFGGSISRLTAGMIDRSALAGARVVHMGVLEPDCMLEIARYVKAHTGALVSIDAGNIERGLIDQLLPVSDIFIPDDVTARRAYGLEPAEACRFFREKGVRIACVTAGGDGAFGLDDSGEFHAPAHPVRVVDTTAAGDNFHGAFLYAHTRGWPLQTCLRFAAVFASLTCEAIGGRAGMPSRERVQEILAQSIPAPG